MTTSKTSAVLLSLLSALAATSGCAGDTDSNDGVLEADDIDVHASALTLTTCTGAAISAAVAAGGDVALDCGSAPITVDLPTTQVSKSTVLRALRPGLITLRAASLFRVASGISFQINGFILQGSGTGPGLGVHGVATNITLNNDVIQLFSGFAVSVHNGTNLTVNDCLFQGNTSTNFAAGIYGEGANLTIRRTTFRGNQSGGRGAAINAFGGSVTIAESLFSQNTSQGGGAAIWVTGDVAGRTVTNTTFNNNGAPSFGGAVLSGATIASTLTFRNCTFSGNTSQHGTISGPAQAFNTIFVDSSSPSSAICQITGASNLQWPIARCPAVPVANPMLLPLANNGGPTLTMALPVNSPAVDGALASAPTIDQRGVTRPLDGNGDGVVRADLGAYERP